MTSETVARLDSSAPSGIGASWRSRPPANMRRRPGIGGRNGASAGWPSAPVFDPAGWSSSTNQCHSGGR
ncbi:hypothetical protein BJF90_09775 [Pseudonocardia sp. CNS-004]|nr:hypothetical protein BJF90_09775 [Pseudonocardia sp. CNS-004]